MLSNPTPYSLNPERTVFLQCCVSAAVSLLSDSHLLNLVSELDVLTAVRQWLQYRAGHYERNYDGSDAEADGGGDDGGGADGNGGDGNGNGDGAFSDRWSEDRMASGARSLMACVRAPLIRPSAMRRLLEEHGDDGYSTGPLPDWLEVLWGRFRAYHCARWPRDSLDSGEAEIRARGATYCDFAGDTLRVSRPACATVHCKLLSCSLVNAVCTADDFLYLEGVDQETRAFYRWDARHRHLRHLASPPGGAVCGSSLATSGRDGGLYSISGRDATTRRPTAAVWQYVAADDTWRLVPPLPVTLMYSGATVDLGNGDLYVGGGTDNTGASSTRFYRLRGEGESSCWTRLSDMLQPRRKHALVAVSGNVYAVGGAHCAIDRYSSLTGAWNVLEGSTLRSTTFTTSALVAYNHLERRLQFSDHRYMYTIDLTSELPLELRECESNIRERLIICRCPSYPETAYSEEDSDYLNSLYKLCLHYFIHFRWGQRVININFGLIIVF